MNKKIAFAIIAIAVAAHFLLVDYYNKSLDTVVANIKPVIAIDQELENSLDN